MSRSRQPSAQLRTLLAERWLVVQPRAFERLELIRVVARSHQTIEDTAYREARRAAHQLAGSLGMFGRGEASAVAAEIEGLLYRHDAEGARTAWANTTSEHLMLSSLVDRLAELIDGDEAPAVLAAPCG